MLLYREGYYTSWYAHRLPAKTFSSTEVSLPGAKKLSLLFSPYSEVEDRESPYDATLQTSMTVKATTLDAPVVLSLSKSDSRMLPGTRRHREDCSTVQYAAPFEVPGDSCTLEYGGVEKKWRSRKRRTLPERTRYDGYHWGWRCLVSAIMDSPDISDFDLASLINLCPNLHPNKLVHFGKGPAFVQAVATHREEITDLDLRLCSAITDAALTCLPAGC